MSSRKQVNYRDNAKELFNSDMQEYKAETQQLATDVKDTVQQSVPKEADRSRIENYLSAAEHDNINTEMTFPKSIDDGGYVQNDNLRLNAISTHKNSNTQIQRLVDKLKDMPSIRGLGKIQSDKKDVDKTYNDMLQGMRTHDAKNESTGTDVTRDINNKPVQNKFGVSNEFVNHSGGLTVTNLGDIAEVINDVRY